MAKSENKTLKEVLVRRPFINPETSLFTGIFICYRTTCCPIWKGLDEKKIEGQQNWTRLQANFYLAVRGILSSNSFQIKKACSPLT